MWRVGRHSAICYANRADNVNPVDQLYVIVNQEKHHIAEGIVITKVESGISCNASKFSKI